jgi:hypothetical protein
MEKINKIQRFDLDEEVFKRIAIEMTEVLLRKDNLSSMIVHQKLSEIIEKIKNKGYFYIHEDLFKDNSAEIKNFEQNKAFLFKNLVRKIPEKLSFNVEMFKFGKSTNSLRSRWAIVIRDEGFFSSTEQIFNKAKNKNKTEILLKAELKSEKRSKETKDEWHSPNKDYRIIIDFTDHNKKNKYNFYYLYFGLETEMQKCKELLMFIKIMNDANRRDTLVSGLKSTLKLVEGSHLFYGVFKLLQTKQTVKNRKLLLNTIIKWTEDSLSPFYKFTQERVNSIVSNIKSRKNVVFPRYKFLYNRNIIFKKDFTIKTLSELKNNINIIKSKFLPICKEKKNGKNSNNFTPENLEKNIAFKIRNDLSDVKINDISIQSLQNFDFSIFKNSNSFTMNKKDLDITFTNDKCKINQEDILNISNIFINYSNDQEEKHSNVIVINGPKKDPKKFLKYNMKKSYLNSSEKFIEPEHFSLTHRETYSEKVLLIQIYHSVIVFEKKELFILQQLMCNILNPLEDLYFFISISLSNKKKIRTKLVKAKHYKDDRLIIEFNLEHTMSIESLLSSHKGEINLRVSLNAIPLKSFDLEECNKDSNIYLDYLNPYEMAYCLVNKENILNGESEYTLKRDSLNQSLVNENKLIMSLFINYESSPFKPKIEFYGSEFSVGNDILALEELNKNILEQRMKDPNIDLQLKELLYDVKFSDKGYLYLRPPTPSELKSSGFTDYNQIFKNFKTKNFDSNKLLDYESEAETYRSGNISTRSDLNPDDFIHNYKFKYLPYIEKFTSPEFNSKNLNMNEESIFKSNTDLNQGDIIYQIKNLKTYLLSNFKGITENKNFVYYNYFVNKIQTCKLEDIEELFTPDFKKFKPIHENQFEVYDFEEIDQSSLENEDNYIWNIKLSFINREEMKAFIILLKDLRRRSNLNIQKTSVICTPVNMRVVTTLTENILKSLRSLKISIEKIEFRQTFILNENKKLTVKVSKQNLDRRNSGVNGRFILETFDESDHYNYINSLMESKEIKTLVEIVKNMKKQIKTLPKEFDLYMKDFNESQKILRLGEKVKEQDKTFDLEVKPGIDKIFSIEILLNGNKTSQILMAICNLDNIIQYKPQADILFIPMFDYETKSILGILNLKIFSSEPVNKNQVHEDLFNQQLINLAKPIKDEYDNFVKLGCYEPNVYKRRMMRSIHTIMQSDINSLTLKPEFKKKEIREKLYAHLKKKCIRNIEGLLSEQYDYNINCTWRDLIVDSKLFEIKTCRKFYLGQKRNEFYKNFAKSEWENFLIKVYQINKGEGDKNEIIPCENVSNLYTLLPNKTNLIKYKIRKDPLYEQLRFLTYTGLPPEGRSQLWETILDIDNLVKLTDEKLHDEIIKNERGIDLKTDFYNYYKSKATESSYYSTIFSIIDNDLNYLTQISENFDAKVIKSIAKSYLLWGDLNILLPKFIKEEDDQKNKKILPHKKFVYFFGLLKIIQKLFSVFKSESQIFWIVIGLSQILEMFNQTNPLFSEDISFNYMIILTTRLLMENNLKPLYSKFMELSFPIEYFLDNLISSFFTDIFQTELFLRLLDIIIFEAALVTNSSDNFDYLRVLCTIPLTLLKMKEKKIMECRSVREMEKIFDDLSRRAFNSEQFIEALKDNMKIFFEMKNVLERFYDVNHQFTWDSKRQKIHRLLNIYFKQVSYENKNFLEKAFKTCNKNWVSLFENEILEKLNGIRNFYSLGTSDPNSKSGVYLLVSNFFAYDSSHGKDLLQPTKLQIWVNFSDQILNLQQYEDSSLAHLIINLDYSKEESGTIVNDSKVIHRNFNQDNFPKYMNLLIRNENNEFIGNYCLEIIKLDLMKPYKIKLESNDKINKTSIEVCVMKYSSNMSNVQGEIHKEDSEIFNLIFNEPKYLYDDHLESEIKGVDLINSKIYDSIKSYLDSQQKYLIDDLSIILNLNKESEGIKFLEKESKKNFFDIKFNYKSLTDLSKLHISEMLTRIFHNDQSVLIFTEWLKSGDSSFEEILYAIILGDNSNISIYDKLRLLFNIAKMKNMLLFNEDKVSVSKLKEMIYSLYKRYMIYFTKSEVDRLIDYLLHSESFCNLKFAGIYHSKKTKEIESVRKESGHIFTSKLSKLNKEKKLYIDLKRQLINLTTILKNQFNLNNLPTEILNLTIKYLLGNIPVDVKMEKLTLDLDSENASKTKIWNIYKINQNEILLTESLENCFNETRGGETTETSDDSIKTDFILKENLIEKILKVEANSIEISNSEIKEISFEQFKKIFFNLPFMSDLIRASSSFNYASNESFIEKLNCVTVEISYPEIQNFNRIFIFAESAGKENVKYFKFYFIYFRII